MRAPPVGMRQNADLNAWANMYITLLDQFPFNYPRLPENITSFHDCLKHIDKIFIQTIGVCKVVLNNNNPSKNAMFFDRPIRRRKEYKQPNDPATRRRTRRR
jgi:hypothetical protein